ncbi:MAG: ferric reductase-like transmembrane domain-containing protein [Anaerolineae bacterium]|nr:ferric reductase-like transmembrane domain-containing protein [Anaerolineae bacterium]
MIHLGALVPAVVMALQLARGSYLDPIRQMTTASGNTALALLGLTLTCTPLARLTGFRAVLRVRRPLGLYTFSYAALHLLIFAGWDYGFAWDLLIPALFTQRFVLAGLAAFVILLALALTSTRGWQQRLGRWWKRLQRWVYAAAGLVVLHVLLLSKTPDKALRYGIVLVLLLVLRWVPARPSAQGASSAPVTKD